MNISNKIDNKTKMMVSFRMNPPEGGEMRNLMLLSSIKFEPANVNILDQYFY